ncbi:MAG: sigma-54 dependent transcriptional regulator [Candidatus Sumerlaeia bacterium]
MKARIIVADDEKHTRDGLKWALEGDKREVALAANGKEALERLEATGADILLTDLKMPQMNGLDLLKEVKKRYPETDVVILTGHGTVESAVEAMKEGAYDYLTKPVNIDELNLLIDRLMLQRRLRAENAELRQALDERFGFENIIGRSPAMEQVFRVVRQVAPTTATVLIQGESGTGKELIARAIHYNSPRRHRPFVAINCGALSATLLESELFGHEKGAFTHAIKQKPGRFELADGGTILLDEIGETSMEFQVKILRVLQEQEFERVGGIEKIKVDVRVLTATNKNLEELVSEGRFREDLFYRLNVVRVVLPPLRERREDIPLLIEHFTRQFCRQHGKDVTLSPRAIAQLQQYSWPGNVRQLRNVIEGLIVMATTRQIGPDDLPPEIRQTSGDDSQFVKVRLGSTLKDAEKEIIQATLQRVKGNKAKAARLLGIGRKTLYQKMKEYKLYFSPQGGEDE